MVRRQQRWRWLVDFINLSSGLAWLAHPEGPTDYRLVRIQSTACEQKRWNALIDDLDYDFMLAIASGCHCRVWDASAKKPVSRALYQGIPWIIFALESSWFGRASDPMVKNHNVRRYFAECFAALPATTLAKLRYGRKFVRTENILVEGHCMQTDLDGNYQVLSSLLAV
jgi:hypothetical protein